MVIAKRQILNINLSQKHASTLPYLVYLHCFSAPITSTLISAASIANPFISHYSAFDTQLRFNFTMRFFGHL